MKESDIRRYIKNGWTDEQIRYAFRKEGERTEHFTKKGKNVPCSPTQAPRHTVGQDKKESILNGVKAAGFTLTHDEVREHGPQRADIYHGTGKGCALSLIWHRHATKRRESAFSLRIVMPDTAVWYLTYFDLFNGNINKVLTGFIRHWHNWHQQHETIEQQIQKVRKKLEIGASTLEAVLHEFKSRSGLTYDLRRQEHDSILRIKLRYRRCIEIKLRPGMNMALLSAITEMIAELSAVLDKVGSLNLTVKNYGNNMEWKQAERDGDMP